MIANMHFGVNGRSCREVYDFYPNFFLFFKQLNARKLANTVDRNEQIQLAVFRTKLCNINVEIADRVLLEFLFLALILIFRQCKEDREKCWICHSRAYRQSSRGNRLCLRNATQIASSFRPSTVE